MFKLRSFLVAMALSGLLTACGGGGDVASGVDQSDTPPPTNIDPGAESPTGSGDAGAPSTGTDPTPPTDTGSTPPTTPPSSDPMVNALATGNAKNVTLNQVAQSTQTLLSSKAQEYAHIKQALFGLNANGSANASSLSGLTWNPTHDSVMLTANDAARNLVVLGGNWSYSNNAAVTTLPPLAVVGTTLDAKAHYAVFGGNPMGVPGNAAMDSFIANTIAWLAPRAAASDFKVVVAHMPGTETYWFPHESKARQWLVSHYPTVTINGLPGNSASQKDNVCDGGALAACLQNADLLIIGREQGPNAYDGPTVMQAITEAQSRGIPVIFFLHGSDANGGWGAQASDLAYRLLAYFGLGHSDNYWTTTGLNNFNPSSLPATSPALLGLSDLITRLTQGTFSSNWSGCNSSSPINCSGDQTYMNEFGTITGALRNTMRALDSSGTVIFGRDGAYELEKRMALLGDKFRESVSYPLDKIKNEQDFFRALFSDVAAYVHRGYSSVAVNLGNYSSVFPASTPTISQQVSVALPTSGSKDYLTGLYIMPGITVTLTRSDSSAAAVSFSIHKLRDTTRAFDTNGLDRPKQITSPNMPLVSGQAVTITSPYGGPLILTLNAASGSAQTVTVQVSGVVTHPVLRDATNASQVNAFQNAVNSTTSNWVAVTSDMLTLISTLDHFKQTMSNYSNDMNKLASDTWVYLIKGTYELAGFNSATGSFVLAPKVSAFCQSKGWDCTGTQHRRDVMQYVISDVHALCGSGCSGNPYDQDWAYTPLGWGESHEIGHNIQPGRLEIYGGISGEVSNNVFPMHKQMVFNQTPEGQVKPMVARGGAVKSVFTNVLQPAQAQADPTTKVYNSIWADSSYAANNSERLSFYRQIVEFARYYNPNTFSDGWELITLLYLQERNFGAVSSANWATFAASNGFGSYATKPSLNGNDFMVMVTSYIIGRDMRPVFDLWGITYSAAASSQVNAYGFAPAEKLLFPMANLATPTANVGAPFLVTSTATYPAGY